jgi:ADP-ribose pyrophosphatase
MKFKSIKKIQEGKFITRYNIEYETVSGKPKTYEIISRSKEIDSLEKLHDSKIDAVIMIMHDESRQKILLSREYRMAVGEWVFNFPAGLIDPGENVAIASVRELREETGLTLIHIDEIWPSSYSAVGFSNEKNIVITGVASGEIKPSDSEFEEIEARWYTKQEVKELLAKEPFAGRTQAYCAMWCREG